MGNPDSFRCLLSSVAGLAACVADQAPLVVEARRVDRDTDAIVVRKGPSRTPRNPPSRLVLAATLCPGAMLDPSLRPDKRAVRRGPRRSWAGGTRQTRTGQRESWAVAPRGLKPPRGWGSSVKAPTCQHRPFPVVARPFPARSRVLRLTLRLPPGAVVTLTKRRV